jgi:hypothetical protein
LAVVSLKVPLALSLNVPRQVKFDVLSTKVPREVALAPPVAREGECVLCQRKYHERQRSHVTFHEMRTRGRMDILSFKVPREVALSLKVSREGNCLCSQLCFLRDVAGCWIFENKCIVSLCNHIVDVARMQQQIWDLFF